MLKPNKIILENGITLLLIENHQSPVVAFNACFRVGSTVETHEEAGICHLIEHMIFKGTPTRPAGQIAASIEAAGGEINAYTSFDETVYYCTLSSRYFDEGLNILSDAVLNPLFDETELAREKPVVLEEIKRSHDTPGKLLAENLFALAYTQHPYGRPIIGFPETVKSFTRQKLLDFYHHWYVPKNLVFVVSGDFDPTYALKRIQEIFASYSKPNTPQAPLTPEPPQTSPRLKIVRKDIEGLYAQIAFPIPSMTSLDMPALDVLSHLLGEGLSSRLEIQIKEKKSLVDSVYSYAYSPKHPGLFVVGFTTNDKKLSKAIEAILQEISKLSQDKLTHAELARARLNIKSDAWYEKETVEGLARKYGYFETQAHDCCFEEKYYQLIDEVDPDAVHEVAKKYLDPQKMNLAILLPEQSKLSEKDFSFQSLKTQSKPAAVKKETGIKKIKLKNGIRLLLQEKSQLPLVSIRLVNLGGLRLENSKNNGIHHLLARTLTKGTHKRSSEKLALSIEEIAGSIDAFSGKNLDGLQGDFLSEKIKEGLNLFTEVLLEPAFETSEIEKEKRLLIEGIRRENDQPASLAYKHFFAKLYPTHPYGMPVHGTLESVPKLSHSQLVQAHQALLDPSQMVISVVGDFDPDWVCNFFETQLGKLKKTSRTLPKLPTPEKLKSPQTVKTPQSKMQTHIALGFLGTTLTNKDRYALDVLNNILAGQGGRLFIELRDKLSLAYTVTSFSQEGLEPGYFSVYIATDPEREKEAIEGIFRELRKIQTDLVGQSELERAQKYLVGSFEIDLQRSSNLASQMAFNEIYGLGAQEYKRFPEKVFQVTREDILKVAKKYLDLNSYVLSIVGKS